MSFDLHECWNREATHPNQQWILAEDYAALQKQNAALRSVLSKCEALLTRMDTLRHLCNGPFLVDEVRAILSPPSPAADAKGRG